jgi:HD-like signal output (HDOD) protein
MELPALLEQPLQLPKMPRVLALLLFELDKPEPDLMRINQWTSTDPALTWQLLQIANAPYFQMPGKIQSLSQSLALLGLGHLRSTVAQARETLTSRSPSGLSMPKFWRYSLNTAKVARSLAGILRINQQAAYTAGLVHAVGELVMWQSQPQQMEAIGTSHGPLSLRRADVESKRLGYHYADVVAAMARQHQFPSEVVDALQDQSHPFEGDNYEPLAGVLHLAIWRARAKEANLDERGMAVTFPGAVGDILKLDIDLVLQQDPIDWYQTQRQQLGATY